jgi:hypothetical protein
MSETSKTTAITFRCPSSVIDSIDTQAQATKQNRTDVLVDLINGSIPNIKLLERHKLPPQPAIYIVFTPDKQLLYVGKTDNLNKRWYNHHKYQSFIETSLDCRIGYFTLDSIEDGDQLIEELQQESNSTPNENVLVTKGELNQLRQELYALKRQFDITYSSLSQIGLENMMKRFATLKPPKGKQAWEATSEDRSEGIVRSNLMKQFGFNTTTDLESAASFYTIEPDKYLEELSGWQCRPIEPGSSRTRFYPPK